jgi:hypothetical protein
MSELELRVQVVDGNLVVSMPGYSYSVTYYKPDGSPGLLMRQSVTKNDLRLRMTAAEFLALAWKARQRKGKRAPLDIVSAAPSVSSSSRLIKMLGAWRPGMCLCFVSARADS